jgi:hypothetical protein
MAGTGRTTRGRKSADEVFLLAMACGSTVENAAAKAGISPRTAHRRLLDSGFQRRLDEIKTDMVKRAAGMLTAAAGEAVKTMMDLLKPPTPHSTRLGAARGLLEMGTRLRESAEIQVRIEALEHLMKAEGDGQRPGPSDGQHR